MGMGLGSAGGWLWERVHRSRRRVQPDTVNDARIARPSAAPPAAMPVAGRQSVAGIPPGSKTLIIIFGPPAVGKMTVGEAVARRTGLRVFHNHLTIDPVLRFFEFGSAPFKRLVSEFRTRIFEEVAASSLPGMIFTYVWSFSDESDTRYVERMSAIFRARGADVYLVELEATQAERLRRNETELRLAAKESKRDVVKSRAQLLELDHKYRLNSKTELEGRSDYLRIDNTELSADEVAERIIQRFGLRTTAAMETV
jgi:shikimate kinase